MNVRYSKHLVNLNVYRSINHKPIAKRSVSDISFIAAEVNKLNYCTCNVTHPPQWHGIELINNSETIPNNFHIWPDSNLIRMYEKKANIAGGT